MDEKNIPHLPANDHDLLIVMHTLLNRVIDDVEKMRDEIGGRVTKVENTKANEDDTNKKFSDHESRIRRLEKVGFIAIGGLFIVELIFHFVTKL